MKWINSILFDFYTWLMILGALFVGFMGFVMIFAICALPFAAVVLIVYIIFR